MCDKIRDLYVCRDKTVLTGSFSKPIMTGDWVRTEIRDFSPSWSRSGVPKYTSLLVNLEMKG